MLIEHHSTSIKGMDQPSTADAFSTHDPVLRRKSFDPFSPKGSTFDVKKSSDLKQS